MDHTPRNREEMSQQLQASNSLEIYEHFERDHLHVTVNLADIVNDRTARGYLATYRKQKKVESYGDVCRLMNRFSHTVHSKHAPSQSKIFFIDQHTRKLNDHPDDDRSFKPDIHATRQSVIGALCKTKKSYAASEASAHHPDSFIELKTTLTEDEGLKQAAAYAGLLDQARPDKPGVYVAHISPNGYQIIWSDPSGLYISKKYSLDDILPLVKYVYCLYHPPSNHPADDSTITLANPQDADKPPRWTICFDGETYENCSVISVGRPWTRMSWVAIPRDKPTIVIKDTFVSSEDRKEGEFYDLLQRNGRPAPGWVHMVGWGVVKNGEQAIETPVEECRRTKIRMIMDTTGNPLYACESVLDFLKAMYDVLESHRWAVSKRGILHRDISYSNILIYPQGVQDMTLEEEDRPKFINEILGNDKYAPPVAVLYDLDHATLHSAVDSSEAQINRRRKERTGTPMYVSRAVSQGSILFSNIDYYPMPSLTPDVRELYTRAHPQDALRSFEEYPGKFHGGICDHNLRMQIRITPSIQAKLFCHEPWHDVESVYWVIVSFLLRAKPFGDNNDANNVELNVVWRPFANHRIADIKPGNEGGAVDGRLHLFRWPSQWEAVLHPKLAGLAGLASMMTELGYQVQPEYAFIKPRVSDLHLHEAMQRVILEQIWKMVQNDDDIRLDTDSPRAVEVPIDDGHKVRLLSHNKDGGGRTGTGKRKLSSQDMPSGSTTKRKRVTRSTKLAVILDEDE